MKKETILYFYPATSSFVRGDIEALNHEYEVRYRSVNWANKWLLPISFLRQFVFLLANVFRTKIYIASFAGYHTFLPVLFSKLFRKKIFIILNGTDSVGIKELQYGSHLKTIMRVFCKFSLKNATELWPVSKTLISGQNRFIGTQLDYGIRVSFPSITTPYTVIPNGLRIENWRMTEQPRKPSFITVISSIEQFHLKGVDLVCEYADKMKDLQFTIVGAEKPEWIPLLPNVTFIKRVPQSTLNELFNEHKYYLQLSSFEGFGCSLCEAMLCGCIPVGSNVNEIPIIIGLNGGIVSQKTVSELSLVVKSLESLSEEEVKNIKVLAHNSICERYSIVSRFNMIKTRLIFHKVTHIS